MSKFWNMSIEEVMNATDCPTTEGLTPARNSDSPNEFCDDTYYSRSNIAQLSLHEKSAEELIKEHSPLNAKRARTSPCDQSPLVGQGARHATSDKK